MRNKKGEIIYSVSRLVNIAFMVFTIFECFVRCYNPLLEEPYYRKGFILIALVFAGLYVIFTGVYDAFDIRLERAGNIAYSQILSLLLSDGVMYIILVFIMKRFPSVIPALITLAVQLAFILIWSPAAKRLYIRSVPALKSVVVYDDDSAIEELISGHGLDSRFDVRAKIHSSDCVSHLQVLEGADAVFLSDSDTTRRDAILDFCVKKHIRVFLIPQVDDMFIYGAGSVHMLHMPVMKVGGYEPDLYYLLCKRVLDIIFSALLIIILSPVGLATAIAVKKCDGGPVFYRQQRLTKGGKVFEIFKFRSMRVDAEQEGAVLSSGSADPRVTSVGRVIRKIRLDELPQLFNIFLGDMSFVGPRPERPEIAEQYCRELPDFSLRLQAKAGLTGYAQVYGKYNTLPEDKLRMDLMYLSRPSIASDIALIFATIKILFIPESTEGVGENGK